MSRPEKSVNATNGWRTSVRRTTAACANQKRGWTDLKNSSKPRELNEQMKERDKAFDRQMKESREDFDRRMKESDRRIEENRKETDRRIEESRRETDKQIKEMFAETNASIRRMSVEFIGVTGHIVEGSGFAAREMCRTRGLGASPRNGR